ncbi:hypothetical protein GCM10028824_05270 [Hymenobacter segetis]|uniref:Uncharacterized protein n=1 Tax=Hymenobacter segetis TaxID=2025509 RepID=A0ABU9LW99_9BACT
MRTLLKLLLGSLLLVLIVALGTEVVALHRSALPLPTQTTSPVVVRKSTTAPMPPKMVRPVADHRPPPTKLRKAALPVHDKAPAN